MANDIFKVPAREVLRFFELDCFFTAFQFSWDESFYSFRERHSFWEIVFVTSGCVKATQNEQTYLLRQNDILIHAPMVFHTTGSAENTCPQGYILSFRVNGELPKCLANSVFTLNSSDAEIYISICQSIIRFLDKRPVDLFLGQYVADAMGCFLIRLAGKIHTPPEEFRNDAILFQRIVGKMSSCTDQNLSLSEIASACNISLSYLKKVFKKFSTVSPRTYYNRLQIQRAISLLNTGISNAMVANILNLSSPSYFSSFFKKQTGETPSHYRKHIQKVFEKDAGENDPSASEQSEQKSFDNSSFTSFQTNR